MKKRDMKSKGIIQEEEIIIEMISMEREKNIKTMRS